MNRPFNLGGPELVFIAFLLLLIGLPLYAIYRRSGTRSDDPGGSGQELSGTGAGFWRRALAYLMDLVVISVPLLLGDAALRLLVKDWGTLSLLQNTLGWTIGLLGFVSYFIGLWIKGGTVGQRMLGLAVVGVLGTPTVAQAASRLVALVVTQIVVLGIPFAFVFFIANRLRSRPFWHDTVSGTRVIIKQGHGGPSAPIGTVAETAAPIESRETQPGAR